MKILIRTCTVFLLICQLSVLLSCRGGSDSASTDPAVTPPASPVTNIVENSSGFNVKLKPLTDYTYILHKGTGSGLDNFSSPCVVSDPDGTAASDITCIAEAKELDLFYNGISFVYNIPQNTCEYLSVLTPYFYNFQPGQGPAIVIDNRLSSSDTTISGTTALAGQIKVGSAVKSSIYCDYDYSNSYNPAYPLPLGGPNCCTGKYDGFTVDSTGLVSSSPQSWGGSYSSCLKGPAMQSGMHLISSGGYPVETIKNVLASGLNSGYSVTSPVSMNLNSNVYAANYFNPAEHTAVVSNIPVAYAATGGAPQTNPSPWCRHRGPSVRTRDGT